VRAEHGLRVGLTIDEDRLGGERAHRGEPLVAIDAPERHADPVRIVRGVAVLLPLATHAADLARALAEDRDHRARRGRRAEHAVVRGHVVAAEDSRAVLGLLVVRELEEREALVETDGRRLRFDGGRDEERAGGAEQGQSGLGGSHAARLCGRRAAPP
jgi:hypothetical protein